MMVYVVYAGSFGEYEGVCFSEEVAQAWVAEHPEYLEYVAVEADECGRFAFGPVLGF